MPLAAPGSAPRATVVTLVNDGAPYLPALMESLAGQHFEGGLEVLAVDSGSKDRSVEILEDHGARVIRVPPASFDHGATRNLAASEARGASVVFLSQDALPADGRFVQSLVDALEADSRLAGVFARQVPRPAAEPLTRRDLLAWVAAGKDPRVVRASAGAVANNIATLAREGASVSAWLAAPAQALAASYGQYRGARDEAAGRPYPDWA